jgi:hypothetical protein
MQLSPNFSQSEFERDASLPPDCVPVFTMLCLNVLEAIRSHVGVPMVITSGYRPPEANAAAHGVANSQHIATSAYCAADWQFQGLHDLRSVFDWIRLKSGLSIDQLILEHQENGGADVIHTSYVIEGPRREALEGSTANQSAYMHPGFNDPAQAANYNWTA